MLDFESIHLTWKGHDVFCVRSFNSDEALLHAPTLKVALLVRASVMADVQRGIIPKGVEQEFQRRLPSAEIPFVSSPKAFHLAIGLSKDCTLECRYCHANAGLTSSTVDPALVEIATEYAFFRAGQTPNRLLTVSFAVGGEPTMPWELFQETVNRIRCYERNHREGVAKVHLSMTTNGFYGDAKRKYVSANFDHVTLSLDGDSTVQDVHRPTPAGTGSYLTVAATFRYFLKCPSIRAGIRATVSAQSVSLLPAIVEHFSSEFGAGYAVTFEPLVKTGRALAHEEVGSPSNEEFITYFLQARKRGRDLGIRVMTSAANTKRLIQRFCGAMSIPSFTLCCNGQITACHRDQDAADYRYGSIDVETRTVVLDPKLIEANVTKAVMPAACNKCFAKWHCAGDCPDIRRIGFSRCDVNRYLIFHDLLEQLGERRMTQ